MAHNSNQIFNKKNNLIWMLTWKMQRTRAGQLKQFPLGFSALTTV